MAGARRIPPDVAAAAVGVDDALVRHEFEVFAAGRMRMIAAEVRERHAVPATHARIESVDMAGEPPRRQKLRQRVGIEERATDVVGVRTKGPVQAGGSGLSHRGLLWLRLVRSLRGCSTDSCLHCQAGWRSSRAPWR